MGMNNKIKCQIIKLEEIKNESSAEIGLVFD